MSYQRRWKRRQWAAVMAAAAAGTVLLPRIAVREIDGAVEVYAPVTGHAPGSSATAPPSVQS